MLEIPEAITITSQINRSIIGRKITKVIADYSPHKFAWYHGNPQDYSEVLKENTILEAVPYGGMVRIKLDSAVILISDGVNIKYDQSGQEIPEKHQLLLELDDSSKVSAVVQMYGGIWCFQKEREFDNMYYQMAKEKPSVLSDEFDKNYFDRLISSANVNKLSVKAFLTTEQRIPGLGNGVLQDILWNAQINPKCKLSKLKSEDFDMLYEKIKSVLKEMVEKGGRDTEKDFFGNKGGYKTIMSKNTIDTPCRRCGSLIKKSNYLGGSVYYCDRCQWI
jgi:formamidopyrimidine-DNA glycosylase